MKQRINCLIILMVFLFLSLSVFSQGTSAQTQGTPAQGQGAAQPQAGQVQGEPGFPGEPWDVFIPSRTGPAIVPGSQELPRSFRELHLEMSLEELKDTLSADSLFSFRGDRDVSFLPAREENLVETTGLSFIRRAFFQLRSGKVFIMAFTMDPRMVDHYSVFVSLIKKYGEPVSLNPQEAVWENDTTRVSLERPLTVKYIDMNTFKAIMGEAKAGEAAEMRRREGFLNEF
ncbi:hypothetical protein AGMMS50230_04730 [Spirochaetia bacterium]|nr:hypothetical protein AGMMS50230_04730 [Spirochaetia bacterium]